MSVPAPSASPWVPINGPGPQGPQGVAGAKGPPGDAGAEKPRYGVYAYATAAFNSPQNTWTQVTNWGKGPVSGDWGPYGHVLIVPATGWYVVTVFAWYQSGVVGNTQSTQKRVRVGVNATVDNDASSGYLVCDGQNQVRGDIGYDDQVGAFAAFPFSAGDGLRAYVYNDGSDETCSYVWLNLIRAC